MQALTASFPSPMSASSQLLTATQMTCHADASIAVAEQRSESRLQRAHQDVLVHSLRPSRCIQHEYYQADWDKLNIIAGVASKTSLFGIYLNPIVCCLCQYIIEAAPELFIVNACGFDT